MTINVITAIKDGEFESEVANLLFHHGCEIALRALEPIEIADFILQLPDLERWYLISCPDFALPKQIKQAFATHLITVNRAHFSAANLIEQLSDDFRPPLRQLGSSGITANARNFGTTKGKINLITIFGASGGAGTTTIAQHIYFRIQQRQQIEVITNENQLTKAKADSNYLAEFSPVTSLNLYFTDRRKPAQYLTELVKTSSKIALLTTSTENGLTQLEKFLKDYRSLKFRKPLTVILNKHFYDKTGRVLLQRFNYMISEENEIIMRNGEHIDSFVVAFNHGAINRFPVNLNLLSDNFFKQVNQIAQNWLRLPEPKTGKSWLDGKSFKSNFS